MNIKIEQELISKVNHSLKYNQSQFKNIEDLTEYLFKQYVSFHENGDDLYELIESYNDTHSELQNIDPIEDDLDIDMTYHIEDDDDEDYI